MILILPSLTASSPNGGGDQPQRHEYASGRNHEIRGDALVVGELDRERRQCRHHQHGCHHIRAPWPPAAGRHRIAKQRRHRHVVCAAERPEREGERGQDAAFSDAEDRPRGALTTDLEPWIAVAGNHKGVGGIVCLHHPAQRHHDAFDVGLGLNSKWAFRKGGTHDLRTVRKSQRVQCRIETSGDGFIRIRIDNVNTPRGCIHHSVARWRL